MGGPETRWGRQVRSLSCLLLQATSPRATQTAGAAEPERPVRGRRLAWTRSPSGANRQLFHFQPPETPGGSLPASHPTDVHNSNTCQMPAPLWSPRSSGAWVRRNPSGSWFETEKVKYTWEPPG